MEIIFEGGPFDGQEDWTQETDALTRDGVRYENSRKADNLGRTIFEYVPREVEVTVRHGASSGE